MKTASGNTAGEVLGRRSLNRALLARQMFLKREAITAAEAIERLVGMQAQVPSDPYYGLWSRLEGFRPGELSELVATRKAVRIVAHCRDARDDSPFDRTRHLGVPAARATGARSSPLAERRSEEHPQTRQE